MMDIELQATVSIMSFGHRRYLLRAIVLLFLVWAGGCVGVKIGELCWRD
jgi:hypothetical protein